MIDVKVSEGGRVVIPAELRAKLGIGIGDILALQQDGERLVLTTRRAGIRQAQALVAQFIPPGGPSVVDELIRERREAAARE